MTITRSFAIVLALLGACSLIVACDPRDGADPATPAKVATLTEPRGPVKGTPADFTAGSTATVEAARACSGSPPVHAIAIALPGHRTFAFEKGGAKCAEPSRFASLSPDEVRSPERDAVIARKCAAPAEPSEAWCGVFFDAFGREVVRRATSEGVTTTGYGIGGCDREPEALHIAIDDWRSANRLVRIIEEEAARWDVAGSIAVLVAGIPIVTPE